MVRYWYERERRSYQVICGSLGQAVDVALMDMSSGQAQPLKIEMHDYVVLDSHDIQWLYARSWNAEYDRATEQTASRRTGA